MVKFLDWRKEALRDILALGSWIFYLLVFARAMIKPYRPFVDQLVIAAVVLAIFYLIFKDADYYLSRAIVIVVLSSIFYQSMVYSVFVCLVFLIMIYSSYLIHLNIKKVIFSIFIGGISVILAYWLVLWMF